MRYRQLENVARPTGYRANVRADGFLPVPHKPQAAPFDLAVRANRQFRGGRKALSSGSTTRQNRRRGEPVVVGVLADG